MRRKAAGNTLRSTRLGLWPVSRPVHKNIVFTVLYIFDLRGNIISWSDRDPNRMRIDGLSRGLGQVCECDRAEDEANASWGGVATACISGYGPNDLTRFWLFRRVPCTTDIGRLAQMGTSRS